MAAKKDKKNQPGERLIAQNRRARFEYHVLEDLEAGIVLTGSEIKSIRQGQASIAEAYARFQNGELWLLGMHIAEYFEASFHNHETRRKRKLLLHASELRKLEKKVKTKGVTLVPLDLHFNDRGIVKVKLGLCTGKKDHDKRETIKKRDAERELRSYKR
ncbi:MAG: SsrA-binding protein SmpB [Planctomycetes bacterium]|nr:SsrA-binding protein SmpB [Planctomycetota bacterium]